MENTYNRKNTIGFFSGLLVGGLIGAGAMLLFAPQSGTVTRNQFHEKSIDLRDQTVKTMEEKIGQVRAKAGQLAKNVQKQADPFQQRGQKMPEAKKETWSPVVETGKTAVQD